MISSLKRSGRPFCRYKKLVGSEKPLCTDDDKFVSAMPSRKMNAGSRAAVGSDGEEIFIGVHPLQVEIMLVAPYFSKYTIGTLSDFRAAALKPHLDRLLTVEWEPYQSQLENIYQLSIPTVCLVFSIRRGPTTLVSNFVSTGMNVGLPYLIGHGCQHRFTHYNPLLFGNTPLLPCS